MPPEPEELAEVEAEVGTCRAEYNRFGEPLYVKCPYPPEDEMHDFWGPEELEDIGCFPDDCCFHHEYVAASNLPDGYY